MLMKPRLNYMKGWLYINNTSGTIYTTGQCTRCTMCTKQIKFTVFPFYKITTEDDDTCRAKEEYFIIKFKPDLN